MGYITDQIADEAASTVQRNGRAYFASGAVRRIDGDNQAVSATVQGSMRYEVEISFYDDFLEYSCSCPFFERDSEPCKHIWATALAAEKRGYLQDALRSGEDDWVEDDDEDENDFVIGGPRARGAIPALPKKPPEPLWKQSLLTVRNAMEAAQAGAPSDTRPAVE